MAVKKSDLYSSLWESCDQLRGSMDASQYKDYVLVLLFVKYISDRAAGDSLIDVPPGGGFSDLVALKGQKDIGDGINKVLRRLADANGLGEIVRAADFNNDTLLGRGQDMVDRLSKLVAIFENPDLDFSGNAAGGDDLLGDAYEFLMRHFATESGKSKGQFYTPAEVSRVLASVVEVAGASDSKQTIYDPTCGSGALLLKAHDAARSASGLDLAIYGQEMDNATATLARMNMLIHGVPTADIKNDNTLSRPEHKDADGGLKTFDFVVANPPFSQKNWTTGLSPTADRFDRFELGVPPTMNGDYAFLLHILTSMKDTGKGAVILPHGVLFRGNAEAVIRENLVRRGYIKGIIGLPPNLFYGTGIPACVIVLDKEGAGSRTDIFMVDAAQGFKKDGSKNRLRERDIHQIVDVFDRLEDVAGYARMVPMSEVVANDFNLNLSRYLDSSAPEDIHDLDAHIQGGIPQRDIDALGEFWEVFPTLRSDLFEAAGRPGYLDLVVPADQIRTAILDSGEYAAFLEETQSRLGPWFEDLRARFEGLDGGVRPNTLIGELAEGLFDHLAGAPLLDPYDVFQGLMELWEETLRDDVYLVVESGWEAGARLAQLPPVAKGKTRRGRVDFKRKVGSSTKDFRSELIPRELLIAAEFADEAAAVAAAHLAAVGRLEGLFEEYGDEESGLLRDLFGDRTRIAKAALVKAAKSADPDEAAAITEYLSALDAEASARRLEVALSDAVFARYGTLTLEEVKAITIGRKWCGALTAIVDAATQDALDHLSRRLLILSSRYAETMAALESVTAGRAAAVRKHLEKVLTAHE